MSRRTLNVGGVLACAAMIGYALFAQYFLHEEPCPLCLFQRFEVIALGVVFLVAAVHHPGKLGARIYSILIVMAASAAIGTAAWHLWIQSLPPGAVPSCGANLGYLFEIMSFFDVVKKVFSGSGECQNVDLLLGLSWPWWTVIAATFLGAVGAWRNWRGK